MTDSLHIADNEAQVLSRYLIGEKCSDQTVYHYTEAVQKMNAVLNESQMKTWRSMLRSLFYLKLIDSGLALTNPQSPLRKRIFIMLALLESSPDHVRYFLPQERSIWYLIPLGFRAGMSALYGIFGFFSVKLLGVG
ncbi:MAG: hypothetical protein JWO03_1089 [Bacteroidetes bacterium]|nr:hypothetical protein [Bacteroidota bacterium]